VVVLLIIAGADFCQIAFSFGWFSAVDVSVAVMRAYAAQDGSDVTASEIRIQDVFLSTLLTD